MRESGGKEGEEVEGRERGRERESGNVLCRRRERERESQQDER